MRNHDREFEASVGALMDDDALVRELADRVLREAYAALSEMADRREDPARIIIAATETAAHLAVMAVSIVADRDRRRPVLVHLRRFLDEHLHAAESAH